ncbi:MAG TPA: transglycosylase SLT domain-containing protein [Burkholderiales bacterium]|nr:transglycosylase SLT domain-containing protein [Burkholderiales bacterium]
MRRLFSLFLLLLPAVSATALTQDEWFLHARDAYRAESESRLDQAVANLNGHVLEPYARYWRLRLNLDRMPPGEISEFLNRNERTYLADQLRKEWLKQLGKRQQWELFDVIWAKVATDDVDANCYIAQRQWRLGEAAGVDAALAVWQTPREIPEGCLPVLEAQIASGAITNEQVWNRVRLLWEAGQNAAVQQTVNYLPAAETPEDRERDAITKNPQRYLDRADKLDLSKRLNRELLVYALMRQASSDPELASTYWNDKTRGRFSSEEQAYVWGQLATQAAKKHLQPALSWFNNAQGASLSAEQLQWWARAALRAGDWTTVRAVIERMPEVTRNDAAWIYWQGRALAALGEPERAASLYQIIAASPAFYGRLAQEELGLPLAIPAGLHAPTLDELQAATTNPGLRRAIALFKADLWLEGVKEWNWSIRDMDDRQLLAAAELARRTQLWDRAINTADRTVALHDYSLRYLSPYRDQFALRAREQGLEEHWVLGLVRQESRFVAQARSSAGAQGLMQVMPATAKWVAKRMGMSSYRPGMVADVNTNIALGTGYLRYVLDQLDGSPVLAAAAYNAGPGRARRWKADVPLEGAIYAESIPFSETRDYVKKVMTNSLYYAALNGGEARSLRERLGIIPPKETGESYAPSISGEATVQ